MLKETLEQHIDPTWKNEGESKPIYRIYDLLKPHCVEATTYKAINGEVRYKCRHDISDKDCSK